MFERTAEPANFPTTNVVSVECIFQSLGQAFPSIDGTAGYIAENVSAAGLFLRWQEFPDEAVAVAWKWVSSRHQADRIPDSQVKPMSAGIMVLLSTTLLRLPESHIKAGSIKSENVFCKSAFCRWWKPGIAN